MAPRIVDKQAKRQQITEAAIEVFARNGFQGTSMEDVAERAGVAKGSLYGYFRNKEDLFYAAFESFYQRAVSEGMVAVQQASTAREKLQTLGQQTVAMLTQNIELYPLTLECWAAAGSGEGRERFGQAMGRLYSQYRQLVESIMLLGQQQGEFRDDLDVPGMASILVGTLDGLMLQVWLDPKLDAGGYFARYMTVLFRGMAPANDKGASS